MREKAALCLSTGAEEFWVVDTKRTMVTVTRRSSEETVYRAGDRIPLAMFGDGAEVEVSRFF
jgi:Uma2 family endonuclease